MEMSRSIVPVPGFEKDSYDWPERHAVKLAWVKENRADVIFFGDSLTHFWTAENGEGHSEGLWQELFSGEKVLNLGYGYDRTQNVLWRIANGEVANQDPKMIVVNIGTNQFSISPNYDGDTPETAVAGIREDGTAVIAGASYDLSSWEDLIGISSGFGFTVGVKKEGSVVAEGTNAYRQCEVDDWNLLVPDRE